jgi:hypothetical protein
MLVVAVVIAAAATTAAAAAIVIVLVVLVVSIVVIVAVVVVIIIVAIAAAIVVAVVIVVAARVPAVFGIESEIYGAKDVAVLRVLLDARRGRAREHDRLGGGRSHSETHGNDGDRPVRARAPAASSTTPAIGAAPL